MHLIRRYRIPALFCALAVLLCELVSRPYTEMGISDDWSYIRTAQKLAATGHIVYNGWAAPMLGWQLYLGAAFIKLFGFSFTTVRMSTLLVAMALAFLLQRMLVRANITEFNATLGTLALVLSPLYLMLSVTFMTDITGLFGIVICLYGCLRALRSSTDRTAIAWICFAVGANALFGSSRQISWLGILVMVPSTLWLLRARRRVLIAGAASTFVGVLFIFACLHWLKHQPYSIPEQIIPKSFPLAHALSELLHTFLDAPFLLLPIIALFLPLIRRSKPLVIVMISIFSLSYILLAIHWRYSHPNFLLEPTQGDWIDVHGAYEGIYIKGKEPLFLHPFAQILLTIVSIGGLIGLVASLVRLKSTAPAPESAGISWRQLGVLFTPFTIAYILLLVPRASDALFNRYALGPLIVALVCLVRYYQERIHPRLPLATVLLIGIMTVYGVSIVHNLFAIDRARVRLAATIRSAGIPNTSVDNGWEFNSWVELQNANAINEPTIGFPANAYVPTPPTPPGHCAMNASDRLPHIHPIYGVSFDPNACYGPAPFAPVHYSRWLASKPGTLYVIHYVPQSNR